MKFYKSFIIILIALSGLCLTACEDFLNTSSKSSFTENVVFESIDYAAKELYSAYDALTQGDLWDYNLMWFSVDTDVEVSHQDYDGARNSVCHYVGNPGSDLLRATWVRFYGMIERTNMVIDNLPNGPLWNGEHRSEARKLYAEAIVLRAYAYYYLTALWGDVPFHTESTKATSELYVPKSSRDDIYERLVNDLGEIQEYLPWSAEAGTVKRVSRGVAKGLRARIALMQAGYALRGESENYITRRGRNPEKYYQIARDECWEMMNSGRHRLRPNFEDIWRDIHEYKQDTEYGELFFEVAYGRGISGRVGQTLGIPFSTSPAEPKYGRAAAEFYLSFHYFHTFDHKDLRRDLTATQTNYNMTYEQFRLIGANGNGYRPSKYRRNWIVPNMGGSLREQSNTGVGMPLMRYADIVLMFAEAENEINGPTGEAKDALASVRRRAFAPEYHAEKITQYVDSVAASKDDFFNAIVNERAWEFGGEFIRKYDLIRWNLLGAKKDEMFAAYDNILRRPFDPPYNWVPREIFWREDPNDPEQIEILNPDYRFPDGTSIPGYSRSAWHGNRSEADITSVYITYDRIMNGYRKQMNNYVFPISQLLIDASQGTLTNDIWRPYNMYDQ